MANIQKRGNNSYFFTVSLGRGPDGKYIRKTKTYVVKKKMTPKQLRIHLEQEFYKFEQEVKSNSYIAPNNMTFKDFALNEWKVKWLEKEVGENTIALRLNNLYNHVLPVIGHLPMEKITTLMLLDLMTNLSRKDGREGELSVSSKQKVHDVLVSIFNKAVEWHVIKENPMDGVPNPKKENQNYKELNVYDMDEVKTLLEAVQEEQEHWRVFVTLALATGMRRGELIGLEWKHVDLKNGIIDIQQIVSRTRNGFEIKNPKYNSKRIISIPGSIVDELKAYKIYCREEKMKLQHQWKETEHDWVFFNQYGNHFRPDSATQWWSRFIDRTNKRLEEEKKKPLKKIRFHDLRHTSATLLIAQNVHAKIISERLGHKKISTTMDIYGHALPVADREASKKLDDILSL